MNEAWVVGAAIEATRAREEARAAQSRGATWGQVRRGTVVAANGNGTYNVALAGAAGASQTVENVPSWGGAVDVGAKVIVVIDPARAVPFIAATGGGASGGAGGVIETLLAGFPP